MLPIITAVIILILLIIVVIKAITTKDESQSEKNKDRIIHMSGIYSIVRKSPREELLKLRPAEEIIKQFLADQNEIINNNNTAPSGSEENVLLKHWKKQMETNLREVENGDKNGVEFYYYDFAQECDVCAPFLSKGHFVSREEIYNYPQLIPPFHLGCTCVLATHNGKSDPKDTAVSGLRPFFKDENVPPLPEWKAIATLGSLTQTAETNR